MLNPKPDSFNSRCSQLDGKDLNTRTGSNYGHSGVLLKTVSFAFAIYTQQLA